MNSPTFVNIHTHKKPTGPHELVVRNAYLHRAPSNLTQLPYGISIGLHPWHLNTLTVNECSDLLANLASGDNVIAIGEIGIDRSLDIPIQTQLTYFEVQWNIARALQKPIIIHAVKSYNDLIPFIKKSKVPFIFHQFQGNEQQAKELLKYNVYLSFGKHLFLDKYTIPFQQIPLEHIFLETDTSSVCTIQQVYAKAAHLKGIEVDELKSILFHNFAQLTQHQS